jgi:hypothetical protein
MPHGDVAIGIENTERRILLSIRVERQLSCVKHIMLLRTGDNGVYDRQRSMCGRAPTTTDLYPETYLLGEAQATTTE